ncbi:hypothetical protein [Borreliella garinii]|uniref:hypothetical protein n=1 Tax=Borreliella garinii TaxID=29519 RepID=UPI001AED63EC
MSNKDQTVNINFVKKLKNVSVKIQTHKDSITNEAETKQFFINPFLDAMSYCHTNP